MVAVVIVIVILLVFPNERFVQGSTGSTGSTIINLAVTLQQLAAITDNEDNEDISYIYNQMINSLDIIFGKQNYVLKYDIAVDLPQNLMISLSNTDPMILSAQNFGGDTPLDLLSFGNELLTTVESITKTIVQFPQHGRPTYFNIWSFNPGIDVYTGSGTYLGTIKNGEFTTPFSTEGFYIQNNSQKPIMSTTISSQAFKKSVGVWAYNPADNTEWSTFYGNFTVPILINPGEKLIIDTRQLPMTKSTITFQVVSTIIISQEIK